MTKYDIYKNNLKFWFETMAKKVPYNSINKRKLPHNQKEKGYQYISVLFASMDHCEEEHWATSCCSEKITQEMDHVNNKNQREQLASAG